MAPTLRGICCKQVAGVEKIPMGISQRKIKGNLNNTEKDASPYYDPV